MNCKKCQAQMENITITATHVLFGKEITISDVPAIKCTKCNHIAYSFPDKVDKNLRDAYRNNLVCTKFNIKI